MSEPRCARAAPSGRYSSSEPVDSSGNPQRSYPPDGTICQGVLASTQTAGIALYLNKLRGQPPNQQPQGRCSHSRHGEAIGIAPAGTWHARVLRRAALMLVVGLAAGSGWGAAPASARSTHVGVTTASLAYNQGITHDEATRNFDFDGVSSLTNSGLYRADGRLRQLAANTAVTPQDGGGLQPHRRPQFRPSQATPAAATRVLLPDQWGEHLRHRCNRRRRSGDTVVAAIEDVIHESL